jgi:hypothetical protein
MDKKLLTRRAGGELNENGFRELTDDEMALVGGGADQPNIWPYPLSSMETGPL